MPINYNYPDDKSRYAQLYRLYELLRLDLNDKAQQFKNGQISEAAFRNYQKGAELKIEKVCDEINVYRAKIKADSSINTSLSDVS